MLYVIQRADGAGFRPAWEIDPAYARALRSAHRTGVEILVWRAIVTPRRIALTAPVASDFLT
jgi:sugar fermentation stimulation protein A